MKRRDFLASVAIAGTAAPAMASQGHQHDPLSGPLANATVSFGQWRQGLDRVTTNPPPPPTNAHGVFPNTATVKAGGAVNFIIAGLHQIIVYGPGKEPSDVNTGLLIPDPTPGLPDFPPLINDDVLRVYRGLDPRLLFPTLDRVEVVHFPTEGTHLVICGVLPHFAMDNMYGWVRVLP